MAELIVCEAPVVVDGDSLHCRGVGRVRLLGIDAPDKRRSRPCREGFGDHVCDDRAARSATQNLRTALRFGPVVLTPVGRDRYGRLLAMARAGKVDLSCWQLRTGVARYLVRYDTGRLVARSCKR